MAACSLGEDTELKFNVRDATNLQALYCFLMSRVSAEHVTPQIVKPPYSWNDLHDPEWLFTNLSDPTHGNDTRQIFSQATNGKFHYEMCKLEVTKVDPFPSTLPLLQFELAFMREQRSMREEE